jgi:hypothetical protein
MHHRFVTVYAEIFCNVRLVEKKICLDDKRTECLNKNTERQKYGCKNLQNLEVFFNLNAKIIPKKRTINSANMICVIS